MDHILSATAVTADRLLLVPYLGEGTEEAKMKSLEISLAWLFVVCEGKAFFFSFLHTASRVTFQEDNEMVHYLCVHSVLIPLPTQWIWFEYVK